MINEKDILAMLRNGETTDDIAQKLVDVLNKGKILYNDELAAKAAAEKASKEKAMQETKKIEAMNEILELVYDYIYNFYCKNEEDVAELKAIFHELNAQDVIQQIEEAGAMALQFTNSIKDIEKLFGKTKTASKTPTFEFVIDAGKAKKADDIFKSFFNSLGL